MQKTHSTLNEAAATIKTDFPDIKEVEKEEEVKQVSQTERNTKTDFESTQKRTVVVKKSSVQSSVLESNHE